MTKKKTVKKTFLISEANKEIGFEEVEKTCFIEPMREVKSMQEYEYFLGESQRKLDIKGLGSPDSFWIGGYVVGIQPIRSKENFHYVDWSLENGEFLTEVFALSEGLNKNYLHFLAMVDIEPEGNQIPTDVLGERFNLLIKKKKVDGVVTYQVESIYPWAYLMTAKYLYKRRKKETSHKLA